MDKLKQTPNVIPNMFRKFMPMAGNSTLTKLTTLFNAEEFAKDTLDLAPIYPYALPHKCLISFKKLPPFLLNEGKILARFEAICGKAPQTIQSHLDHLTLFFKRAMECNKPIDYRALSTHELQTILACGNFTTEQSLRVCTALKFLYVVYELQYGKGLLMMDMQSLDNIRRHYSSLQRAVANAHKTPNINQEYFDSLETELMLIINDEDTGINYRMSAALLLLEMYTGIRPAELFTITINSRTTKVSANGSKADYLWYGVPKLSNGGSRRKYAECYMLPGAVTAYELLLELRKRIKWHTKTDALFILEGDEKAHLDPERLSYYVDRIFANKLRALATAEWPNINIRRIENKQYHVPNFTQFRVHLCSYLYQHGVKLHIIELGMSHLSDSMLAYYYRTQDKTFANEHKRTDNILMSLTGNDYDLTGKGDKGEELLTGLLLTLARFRTFARRREEMFQKGYAFEVDRYTKLCRSILSTELYPALEYLRKQIVEKGKDRVVSTFPTLRHIVNELEQTNEELTEWDKQHKS